jgi:hypothetical protein
MIAPILVGSVIDRNGFDAAFATVGGVLFTAAAVAAVLTAAKHADAHWGDDR